MKKRIKKLNISTVVIIILLVLCITEGLIIFKHIFNEYPSDDIFQNEESFSSFLDRKFRQEKKENWNMYDRFFKDDLFSTNNPFEEMEKIQERLEKMMGFHSKKIFNNSWKDWFGERFDKDASNIDIDTKSNEDFYEITIHIPGLKEGNTLNVNIDENNITIDGEFTQIITKNDSDGNIISKHEVHQRLFKTIPVPDDGDATKAKIQNLKDKITITLPKK